jgi:hypothetical protein
MATRYAPNWVAEFIVRIFQPECHRITGHLLHGAWDTKAQHYLG